MSKICPHDKKAALDIDFPFKFFVRPTASTYREAIHSNFTTPTNVFNNIQLQEECYNYLSIYAILLLDTSFIADTTSNICNCNTKVAFQLQQHNTTTTLRKHTPHTSFEYRPIWVSKWSRLD